MGFREDGKGHIAVEEATYNVDVTLGGLDTAKDREEKIT
jgi:hypothetical protein